MWNIDQLVSSYITSVLLSRERGPGSYVWIFLGTLLGPEGSSASSTFMDRLRGNPMRS